MPKVRIIHKSGWMGHTPGTICNTSDSKAFDLVNRRIAEIVIDEKKAMNGLEKKAKELADLEADLKKRERDIEAQKEKLKAPDKPAKNKMIKRSKTK